MRNLYLKMDNEGVLRDQYGRAFDVDEDVFHKTRDVIKSIKLKANQEQINN